MKKITALIIAVVFAHCVHGQTQYPFSLGYTAGQYVQHQTDSFRVSFAGGAPFSNQHWTKDTLSGNNYLSGFFHGSLFFSNAFTKNLFVSKGYYGDYIEVKWELTRYESQVTRFILYRKELGSNNDYEPVASLSSDTRTWQDKYAESGVMYQYKLHALGIFEMEKEFLNYVQGIGFRVPYGRVSGRVTFEGGNAVEGVTILAETDDVFNQNSIYLNGTSSYLSIPSPLNNAKFAFDTAFAFQAWVKPESVNNATLFEKGNQYKLNYQQNQLELVAGGQSIELNFIEKVDTFFHVTAQRSTDSLKIIVQYDDKTIYSKSELFVATTPKNNSPIFIGKSTTGNNFHGYIDEMRVWHKSLTNEEITTYYSQFIDGTEDYLTAYYRLNEGVGNYFYDLARKGFSFNEFHGALHNAQWSSEIPFASQLAVKSVTDKNGNYIISGIPYATDGNLYTFTPVFGIHQFDPNQRILYIGSGDNNHNNVDFTDIASFPVSGTVFYKDTRFPVEGVSLKLDGKTVIASDGIPVQTDATGTFTIDVPIGKHYIQLEKHGHSFVNNGRFPAGNGYFDFQEPLTFQSPFIDSTLIKVVGKVVGGPVQAAKPIGLGKTINNLGNGKMVLTTQKGYDLSDLDNKDTISNVSQTIYTDGIVQVKGVTKRTVKHLSPKQIELEPDNATGEYVAYLLPEKYVFTTIQAGNYQYGQSFLSTLDLTNAYHIESSIDTTVIDSSISPTGVLEPVFQIDSTNYQKSVNFIYRTTPSINVTDAKTGEIAFWEKEIEVDEQTVAITDTSGTPLSDYPIFAQRNKYDLSIAVFERYTNSNNNLIDDVPVTDGLINVQNAIAINDGLQTFSINEQGFVNYSFKAGLPNLIGDLTKSLSIEAATGASNSVRTPWLFNNNPFKGYILGGLPTGNNFVTTGPNEVDFVLRDPYGSNSYASLEKGSSSSTTNSYAVSNTAGSEVDYTVMLGAEVKVFAGIGAGTITETDYDHNINIGISTETNWTGNNSNVRTTENSKTWSTSAEPDFIGADGDVFIGYSTNIVYGISNFLEIIKDTLCPSCIKINGTGGYSLALSKGLRINPKFNTAFQYTQNHIKETLIPNLISIRNIYLTNSPYHTSHIPQGDENYGTANDTSITTTAHIITATDTTLNFIGDSYNYTLKIGSGNASDGFWPSAQQEFVDSVWFFNNQIKNWESILAQNEKEKVEAEIIDNVSFDAGVVISNEKTTSSSEIVTDVFEWTISPSVSTEIGFEAFGTGTSLSIAKTYTHTRTDENETENSEYTTTSYELADGDDGNYFSIDIKDPKSPKGSLVFATRGGQSSCPYESAEVTEYYNPGSILSEATQQIEVPLILADVTQLSNVPSNKPAIFNVQLGNASETGSDAWFKVLVDDVSNQNGALVKLDGSPISNGRIVYVPAGEVVNKTISIEKTQPAVNDYPEIGIILQSDCDDDLSDTLLLSAYFQEVCSGVEISDPNNLWVTNTNTETDKQITIDNYDLNHTGFEKMLLQYKPNSSSIWHTEGSYYVNQSDFNDAVAAGENNVFYINNQAQIMHLWDMKSLQDRNYHIRAISKCANGTENTSEILAGIKDMKRPQVFGVPEPGDGVLEPGDNVKLTFSEPIESGLLLSTNFSVRGVLNGSELRHGKSLYFDGINDVATNSSGINYNNRPLTVEFWTKRGNLQPGIVFHKGDLTIGFNASNQLYCQLKGVLATTTVNYNFTDDWIHVSIVLDQPNDELKIYSAFDSHSAIETANIALPASYDLSGVLTIGNKRETNNYYNGFIHDVRIWETALNYGDASAQMNIALNGKEPNLLSLYSMTELNGNIAYDIARGKQLLINGAQWRVTPSGFARKFNGTNNIELPIASAVTISNQMDFTLEFWFKANANNSNAVMCANGQSTGVEPANILEDTWIVGFNNQGQLYAENNQAQLTEETGNYLDDTWHHFALVLNRKANTAIYIDGELKTYASSDLFGGFKGTELAIGSDRNYTNSIPFTNYFTGDIDEFRIWNLARTQKLISLDQHTKLTGNELGLVAYYPFDKYNTSMAVVLEESLADAKVDRNTGNLTGLVATENGTGVFEQANVPMIADARPVQNLNFSWVTNNDQLIINLLEPSALVENCVIEFTVERVEDLNENRMASPVTWTAFINKNTVLWDQTQVDIEMLVLDETSFEVDIVNLGGIEEEYTISNLPTWLNVSPTVGSLSPLSQQTIQFTIDPAINIGKYEEAIYLSTDFGYKEQLFISLKVKGEEPNWDLNSDDYENSMSIVGLVKIDGTVSIDEDDKLVAMVQGEVRGVAPLKYVSAFDTYLALLDVYSNSAIANEELVQFHIWDASVGQVYTDVTPSLSFVKDAVLGSPAQPIVFEAINMVTTPISLNKGWTWVSFPLQFSNPKNLNQIFEHVNTNNGDVIRSLTSFDQYSDTYGWNGGISYGKGISVLEAYKIKLNNNDTLHYSGNIINADSIKIPLQTGWNWIGFPFMKNLPVEGAFSQYNPKEGDVIKSQKGFSIYDEVLGWIGTIDYLQPTTGYMYRSNNDTAIVDTLTYPDPYTFKKNLRVITNGLLAKYDIKPQSYSTNMSLIATVDTDVDLSDFEIVAYNTANKIIGAGAFIKQRFFITLFESTNDEQLTFKLIDQFKNSYKLNEALAYANNDVIGTFKKPFVFTTHKKLSLISEKGENVTVFPTIFDNKLNIHINLTEPNTLSISLHDVTGRLLAVIANKQYFDKGSNKIKWFSSDAGIQIKPGVHFVKITRKNEKPKLFKVINLPN